MKAALYLFRLDVARPTGVQRYAVELASALAKTEGDHEVEFWTGRGAAGSPDVQPPGLAVRTPNLNRRLLHLLWTELGRPSFERVAARDADVVHLLAPTIGLPTKRPQVVTVHDLLPLQHPEWFPRGPVRRFARSVGMSARSGAEIIVPSTYVAEQLQSDVGVGPDRVHVVPEGVRLDLGAEAGPAGDLLERLGLRARRYVLAVGHLTQRKNLGMVAQAVSSLPEDVPFVVVGGDGPGGAQVRADITSAAGGRARLVGHLPDREVRALFEQAGVFVFPSVSEGFGLPVLEGMAFGAPVVAADATCLPEVVGDAGLLVDPNDPDAWASAIARVIEDEAYAADLIERGRRRAREYTWERAAAATWEVYRKACAR
ncbi:MAG TPA: glycosyltransferase family 1 protein [Mycobacteriales bacterium]|nr:glycosyltransferase family 1 protein [Mycobacteriales bacterium]